MEKKKFNNVEEITTNENPYIGAAYAATIARECYKTLYNLSIDYKDELFLNPNILAEAMRINWEFIKRKEDGNTQNTTQEVC